MDMKRISRLKHGRVSGKITIIHLLKKKQRSTKVCKRHIIGSMRASLGYEKYRSVEF